MLTCVTNVLAVGRLLIGEVCGLRWGLSFVPSQASLALTSCLITSNRSSIFHTFSSCTSSGCLDVIIGINKLPYCSGFTLKPTNQPLKRPYRITEQQNNRISKFLFLQNFIIKRLYCIALQVANIIFIHQNTRMHS